MTERKIGTVKWLNNTKGFGFIASNDDEPGFFVHYSAIRGDGYCSLNEGQAVEFTVIEGEKGLHART